MLKDPTQFRERFKRWKAGEQVYDKGLPKFEGGKNSYRYYQDGQGGWFRAANDDMTRAFEGLVVTPNGTDRKFIPESQNNTEQTIKARDEYNATHSPFTGLPMNQGLEIVSPEFDLIGLAPLAKAGAKMLGRLGNKAVNIVPLSQRTNVNMNDIRFTPGPTDYTFSPNQYLKQLGLKSYLSGDRGIAARLAASRYGNQGVLYNKYPQSTLNELTNTIIPRLKANRPWMSDREIENLVLQNQQYGLYPSEMFGDAGLSDALGVHFGSNDGIAIRAGYGGTSKRHVIPHEARHRIDNALPLTEVEDKVLADAYDNNFLEVNSHFGGKQYDASVERVTTNSDARAQLLGNVHLEKTSPQLQNKIIDKVPDEQIFEAVGNANGYGQAFIKRLRRRGLLTHEKAEQFRQAMKVVPVALPFALMTTYGLSQPTIQQK